MKILKWNIRGLVNPSSKKELANIVSFHKPALVAISEPLVEFSSVSSSYWHCLHLTLVTVSNNQFPKLWIFQDDSVIDLSILSCGNQQVTIKTRFENASCCFSFIYASTLYVNRRDLWVELEHLSYDMDIPWLVAGDFNDTLGSHEQSGRGLPGSLSCNDFL